MALDHHEDRHTSGLLDRVGRVPLPHRITEFLDLPLRIEPPLIVTGHWGFLIGGFSLVIGKGGNDPRLEDDASAQIFTGHTCLVIRAYAN